MKSPYEALPDDAFWRTAVVERSPFDIGPLWTPKQPFTRTTRTATFGSCFAERFGAALRNRRFAWTNAEPAPAPMTAEDRRNYGYDIFSARIGNVYTTRQMRQWLEWACGATPPSEFWEHEGRIYDPFRPRVERKGFADRTEAMASRHTAISSLRTAVETSDLFVFTLGLTEGWRSRRTGLEFTTAPGIVAEPFDIEKHFLHEHRLFEVLDDLDRCVDLIRSLQPHITMLLTVAPGPFVATASGRHVLLATSECKAILRAAAGEMARRSDCDYFPSYEILTSPPYRSMFFAPNLRNVSKAGIDFVMNMLFKVAGEEGLTGIDVAEEDINADPDPLCDDELIEEISFMKSEMINA